MDFASLAPHFADKAKGIELVESLIRPDGPICPHCGATDKLYHIKSDQQVPQ